MANVYLRTEVLMPGVCPDCGGKAAGPLDVCDSHDLAAGVCDEWGRKFLGGINWRCGTCKGAFGAPSWAAAIQHLKVRTLLASQGLDYRDAPWLAMYVGYEQDWTEAVVSEDPLRLQITFPGQMVKAMYPSTRQGVLSM